MTRKIALYKNSEKLVDFHWNMACRHIENAYTLNFTFEMWSIAFMDSKKYKYTIGHGATFFGRAVY